MKKLSYATIALGLLIITMIATFLAPSTINADTNTQDNIFPSIFRITLPQPIVQLLPDLQSNLPVVTLPDNSNSNNFVVTINQSEINNIGNTSIHIEAGGFIPNEDTNINLNSGKAFMTHADRNGNIFFSREIRNSNNISNIVIEGELSHKILTWQNNSQDLSSFLNFFPAD